MNYETESKVLVMEERLDDVADSLKEAKIDIKDTKQDIKEVNQFLFEFAKSQASHNASTTTSLTNLIGAVHELKELSMMDARNQKDEESNRQKLKDKTLIGFLAAIVSVVASAIWSFFGGMF